MKLWEKGISTDQLVEKFTVGNDRELDSVLAKYDILGSIAHAKMLATVELISEEEKNSLVAELENLLKSVEKGEFEIEDGFEDVHSKVEAHLIEKLGDAGKKIHTARSRNDQILVDLHLYLKDEITAIKLATKAVFDQLIVLANDHKNDLMPGYTHMQVAMPSSFGLWFSGYAETLIDDVIQLNAAFQTADQNPLGSAAGFGSSFPINRKSTTDEMAFSWMRYNSISAQMSRGKLEKSVSFAMASVAGTLSRFAMDICLYMGQNFGFIGFPDSLTTGSSIMPHKKNPDVFELIRARCNKIQALPNELMLITNNLPMGYHRDFQLVKESLFPAIESLKACLEMAHFMLQHIHVNKDLLEDAKYDSLFSVEVLNEKVKDGLSFRDAYKAVAEEIQSGQYKPNKQLNHTHEGSIGNLCLKEIKEKMRELL